MKKFESSHKTEKKECKTPSILSQWAPQNKKFHNIDAMIEIMMAPSFQELSERKKFKFVNKTLLDYIQTAETPCFLLPEVFDWIQTVNQRKILKQEYSFSLFELWLIHFSRLSNEESLIVRGKIAGCYIPRDEYQSFFPIGMNTTLPGSHFIAAHLSPDVDTTVASLMGWIDAFAAKVSSGIHYWSLPSGFSDGYLIALLEKIFTPNFLQIAPRKNPACIVSAIDLVTKKNFHKVSIHLRGDAIEHSGEENAYVVVDDNGSYRGEWRSSDAESVRIVTSALLQTLRSFENSLQRTSIHALGEHSPTFSSIKQAIDLCLKPSIKSVESVLELSDRSKKLFNDYLKKILHISQGLQSSYLELIQAVDTRFSSKIEEEIQGFLKPLEQSFHRHHSADTSSLFRLEALELLEKMVVRIADTMHHLRESIEKLEHLLKIKESVFSIPNKFVFLNSSLEEIQGHADHSAHVTVIVPETDGSAFPIGIIWTNDLKKRALATASLRDFSNLEETKIASYIDIVSIIDHHKSSIKTHAASTLVLGDAQSSNTLIADLSYEIHTRWSRHEPKEPSDAKKPPYFVSRERELIGYLLSIIAILDDTDLLTKVSRKDVLTLEKLLNRMACLISNEPKKIICLDDLATSKNMPQESAKRLLQSEELYTIYKTIYEFKETALEKIVEDAASGKPSSFFSDTKEQNGVCRIGQVKLFKSTIPSFQKWKKNLLLQWLLQSQTAKKTNPHLDFFLQMISTVSSHQEVYDMNGHKWDHTDELWIWVPQGDVSHQHLRTFLHLFQNSASAQALSINCTILGKNGALLADQVRLNYPNVTSIKIVEEKEHDPIIILSFPAGQINSRKSQISPFLPQLIQ